MKIYCYPADAYGCGHYRMIWPAWELRKQGIEVEVIQPGDMDAADLTAAFDSNGNVIDASCPDDADVLVFQRPSYAQLVKSFPHWRSRGIAVVVDIDDDLSHIDPANPAWTALHPDPKYHTLPNYLRRQIDDAAKSAGVPPSRMFQFWLSKRPPHSWLHVKTAAKEATLVTVSTPALVDRYGRGPGHTIVLENNIPESFLECPRQDSDLIGWAGSVHSHPGDLKAMGGAVADLVRDGGRFMVIGDPTSDGEDDTSARRDLGLDKIEHTGPVEFRYWLSAVSQIGVGVAPLQHTRFNEAKSWLKPLEYAAAGVPWVASDLPEYARLAGMGAGRIAYRRRDWVKHLKALTSNAALRQEESEAVRAIARTLTIEQHAWRLGEVWERAMKLARLQAGAQLRA